MRAGAQALIRDAFAAGTPANPAWAHAAEAAALPLLALQAWNAVLARAPQDALAIDALARLYAERGDEARARALRARLPTASPPSAGPTDEELAPPPMGAPTAGDLARFVHRFAGRAGVHARQWADPARGHGYSPVSSSLSIELIEAHLRGDMTLGTYLVGQGNFTRLLCFDLDATRPAVERAWGDPQRAAELRGRIHRAGLRLLTEMRAMGLDPLLEDSGFKGRHLWWLLPTPVPAAEARRVALPIAARLQPDDPDLIIEVFPRQDEVPPGGLGNLVKLPLGLHLRTGRRCPLLDDEGRPLADPWARLRTVRELPLSALTLPAQPSPARGLAPAAPWQGAAIQAAAPAFTEGDLEVRPRLSAVLSGCAVLREVTRAAIEDQELSRDARVVLEHTLGHFPEGVQAVNYLYDRAGVPPDAQMGRPHRGSPTSCAKVRQRLPGIARKVGCDCTLPVVGDYAHPNLHARGVSAEPPPTDNRPLPELIDALVALDRRLVALTAERDQTRRALTTQLTAQPGARFEHGGRRYYLVDQEGIPALHEEPIQ